MKFLTITDSTLPPQKNMSATRKRNREAAEEQRAALLRNALEDIGLHRMPQTLKSGIWHSGPNRFKTEVLNVMQRFWNKWTKGSLQKAKSPWEEEMIYLPAAKIARKIAMAKVGLTIIASLRLTDILTPTLLVFT